MPAGGPHGGEWVKGAVAEKQRFTVQSEQQDGRTLYSVRDEAKQEEVESSRTFDKEKAEKERKFQSAVEGETYAPFDPKKPFVNFENRERYPDAPLWLVKRTGYGKNETEPYRIGKDGDTEKCITALPESFKYVYQLQHRPVGIATVPDEDEHIMVMGNADLPGAARSLNYGLVAYEKPLPVDKQSRWDLEPVSDAAKDAAKPSVTDSPDGTKMSASEVAAFVKERAKGSAAPMYSEYKDKELAEHLQDRGGNSWEKTTIPISELLDDEGLATTPMEQLHSRMEHDRETPGTAGRWHGAEDLYNRADAIEGGAQMPPIIAYPYEDRPWLYRVMDGRHTILATRMAGKQDISVVMPSGPRVYGYASYNRPLGGWAAHALPKDSLYVAEKSPSWEERRPHTYLMTTEPVSEDVQKRLELTPMGAGESQNAIKYPEIKAWAEEHSKDRRAEVAGIKEARFEDLDKRMDERLGLTAGTTQEKRQKRMGTVQKSASDFLFKQAQLNHEWIEKARRHGSETPAFDFDTPAPVHHDVSQEARDDHGRWAVTGGAAKEEPKIEPADHEKLKDRKIVRILSVEDTREGELRAGENGRDKWVPIPGSGTMNVCDRCGKGHEVHATVQLDDGSRAVVGVGCMKKENAELAAKFKSMESATTAVKKAEAEKALLERKCEAYKRARSNAEKLPFPEITIKPNKWRGEGYEDWEMGDQWVMVTKLRPPDPNPSVEEIRKRDRKKDRDNAKESLPRRWRAKRAEEFYHQEFPGMVPQAYQRTEIEQNLNRAKKRLRSLQDEAENPVQKCIVLIVTKARKVDEHHLSFDFEAAHPREKETHDGKKPGEFAPRNEVGSEHWHKAVKDATAAAEGIENEWRGDHNSRNEKARLLLAVRKVAHEHGVSANELQKHVLWSAAAGGEGDTSGLMEEHAAAARKRDEAGKHPGVVARKHVYAHEAWSKGDVSLPDDVEHETFDKDPEASGSFKHGYVATSRGLTEREQEDSKLRESCAHLNELTPWQKKRLDYLFSKVKDAARTKDPSEMPEGFKWEPHRKYAAEGSMALDHRASRISIGKQWEAMGRTRFSGGAREGSVP